VSTVFDPLGHLFWWVVRGATGSRPKVPATSFASGIIAGAWAVSHLIEHPVVEDAGLSAARLVFGGVLLTFGARIAGGCTSGHGISGMASLGLASFITVASMFGSGIGVGLLIK
jgi:uncharacterized membrane protein YedE/YeeE